MRVQSTYRGHDIAVAAVFKPQGVGWQITVDGISRGTSKRFVYTAAQAVEAGIAAAHAWVNNLLGPA
jgi:hypothetical protein